MSRPAKSRRRTPKQETWTAWKGKSLISMPSIAVGRVTTAAPVSHNEGTICQSAYVRVAIQAGIPMKEIAPI